MLESQIITEYPNADLEKSWFEFLGRSNYPSHYTSPGFFAMPYWEGKNPFALVISEGSNVVAVACGVVPSNEIEIGLPVRPQLAFDPAVDHAELAKCIVEGLDSFSGDGQDLTTIFSMDRLRAMAELGFAEVESTKGNRVVIIDLRDGIDAIFGGLSSSRRANIRKAKRRQLVEVFELTEKNDLDELYPIHVEWCRMKGIKPDSPDCYLQAWSQKNFVKIFAARHDGNIIAGSSFRFVEGGLFEYAGNVSTVESRPLRPNDLRMWNAIEWAAANGFEKFSMGASHPFLQRFGGTIEASFRYRLDKSLFRRHDIAESLKAAAVRTYMSMPEGTRARLKSIIRR